jgi:hypothetical protein
MGDLPLPHRFQHVIIVTSPRATGVDGHGAPIGLYQNYRPSRTEYALDFFQDDQWIAHMLQQPVSPDRVAAAIGQRDSFSRSYRELYATITSYISVWRRWRVRPVREGGGVGRLALPRLRYHVRSRVHTDDRASRLYEVKEPASIISDSTAQVKHRHSWSQLK